MPKFGPKKEPPAPTPSPDLTPQQAWDRYEEICTELRTKGSTRPHPAAWEAMVEELGPLPWSRLEAFTLLGHVARLQGRGAKHRQPTPLE